MSPAESRTAETLAQQSRAYQTVARAIAYLRTHAKQHPTLDTLAQEIGLTPSHLQRVFSDWAGVSPKRFLQIMTMNHARSALAEMPLLQASHAVGLSGPGRLHDLVVTCEAMTPGQLRQAGAGLHLRYGVGPTPFGQALVGWTERGICHLVFLEPDARDLKEREAEWLKRWPKAQATRDDRRALDWLQQIFAEPQGSQSPLHVVIRGTNFQVQVWRALLEIPWGTTTSYSQLAASIGKPTATRAVASAVGANAISVLIPCHRVLRESGALGGYRWGLDRKVALLGAEVR